MKQTKEDPIKKKAGIYGRFFKRPMDFMLSLLAIILLSPLLIVTAFLVRIKLGSPVIFKQKRPGMNEKIFTIYKFRTMTDKKDSGGNLLADGERLTDFGRFLRSTSIDELPELFNVLKGDMSIVGPRPLLVQYLSLYNDDQKHRHDIRPGITGWAQIKGRNKLDWEQRFALDVWYVNNLSFILDYKIILLTVVAVFYREGISANGHETMPDFLGTEDKSND